MVTQTNDLGDALRELESRCEGDRLRLRSLANRARHRVIRGLLNWCAGQRCAFVDELHEVRACVEDHRGLSDAALTRPDGRAHLRAVTIADLVAAAQRIEASATTAYRRALARPMPRPARLVLQSHLYVMDRVCLVLAQMQRRSRPRKVNGR